MVESKEQALNLQNSEQVLISFHEWMVQQARAVKSTNQTAQLSDLDNCASQKGSYFPPSIASEPSIKSSSSASQEHPIDSANKRTFRRARATGRLSKGTYFALFAALSSPLSSLWCGRPIGTIRP